MDIVWQIVVAVVGSVVGGVFGSVIGSLIAWLATHRVEMVSGRHSRTHDLAVEFNSEAMMVHRILVWAHRDIFHAQNFDQQILALDPKGFDARHPLFHFIRLAWFYRQVGLLHREHQIDVHRSRSVFGSQFEMFYTHLVPLAKRDAKADDIHEKLWKDLDQMEWLREGFKSNNLLQLFDASHPTAVPPST